MKKACIVVDDFYKNNRLFDMTDEISNRDNCLYPMYLLREKLRVKGFELATQDINNIEKSEFCIYNAINKNIEIPSGKNAFLILMESPYIDCNSWDISKHSLFNKIFTYRDEYIDNKKYVKVNYSFVLPHKVVVNMTEKEKLCVLIAANKYSKHPLELYSKRVEAIRWFEKNHSEDFDLYGYGWDKVISTRLIAKIYNRLRFDKKIPPFPSYLGSIKNKKDILQKYKFSICYENFRDIPGWITEKIFNSMFAGCIPVYWGANNVDKYVPKSCYIDKRDYDSYEQLYDYIKNINEKHYNAYIDAINTYLKSEAIKQFSAEHYAKTIADEIIKEQK